MNAAPDKGDARAAAVAVLTAIPWLNPYTFGPSSTVVPWMVSAGCALLVWLLAVPATRERAGAVLLALAIAAAATLLHPASGQDNGYLAAGLLLVAVGGAPAGDAGLTRGFCAGLLVAAVLSAVIALLQYVGLAHAFGPLVSSAQVGDAYANLRQPNQFSTLCWMGMAVLLFGRTGIRPAVQLAMAALLAIASAATTSRTALLQIALLAAALVAWPSSPERGHRWRLLGLAVACYAVALGLLPWAVHAVTGVLPSRTLWGRVGSIDSCSSRRVLWDNVLHLVAQRPWIGWGWGELDYAHFVTPYPGDRFCDILDNAHNLVLHLAVELGIPFALLACVGAAVWALRQRPWAEPDPLRQLAWMLVGVVLVHSLLEYPLWYGPFQVAFGAALGWLGVGAALRWAWSPAVRAAFGAAGLALVAAAGWDYLQASQVYLAPQQRWASARDDPLATARYARLFAGQAEFAELTLATPSRENAAWMWDRSREVLHYSPEPRVIERAIESALLLGKDDEAAALLARYKAAFPKDAQRFAAAPRAQD